MENFVAYNPTKLFFGLDALADLGETVKKYGAKVLLMYGKGSVKKNGSYNKVIGEMKKIGATVYEYAGIKPNPLYEDVDKATMLGLEKKVDLIIALGGGSVIDSAKITSLCIKENYKAWDVMKNKVKPTGSLPVISVLTLAATGTEMNGNAVLQNHETKEKIGYHHELIYPACSFLDPCYTLSVPKDHTAYGVVDLIAHCLENYFGKGKAPLADRFVEAIIREAMHFGPLVLQEPDNYEYRANILWQSTMALSGPTIYGRETGDWGVHDIGHTISYLFDTPHGATLAIAYPAWLKLMLERIPERISEFGIRIFGVASPDETIMQIENFFISLGVPTRLLEVDVDEDKKKDLIALMEKNQVSGAVHSLQLEDYERLVEWMF